MTPLCATRDDIAVDVIVVDAPERLAAIRARGCAAAIWRRPASPRFQNWIDGLAPGELPRLREVLRPDAVREAVTKVCDAQGTPNGSERHRFIDDLVSLSALFAAIMGAPFIRLRLDVVTNNACRKFHIDAVVARLICTYRGAGTQYGVSLDDADPRRVFTAPTGAPLLIRGRLWPGDMPSGLLHRSPPIEGTGETRLLLVLDPVHDPNENGL